MRWITKPEYAKIQSAVDLARRAIAADASKVGPWLILSGGLAALAEHQEAVKSLQSALLVRPDSVELHLELASLLFCQDFYEEALPFAKAAFELCPSNADARSFYIRVLAALSRWEDVEAQLGSDRCLLATQSRALENRVYLAGPTEAVALCDEQLKNDPANTNAKYLKAVALALLRRDTEANQLIQLDRLVYVGDLDTPREYNEGSFREALAREIYANPTLTRDYRNKATRDGLQTKQLFHPDAVAVEAALLQIMKAVDAYVDRLQASKVDFAMTPPNRVRLNSWAVVYGREGKQKSHRHSSGWVSGVYYVAAPRLYGENAYRGSLLMGALDPDEHGIDPPWGTRAIEPVPGRVVIFPSYFPHATEPTGIDGARICVAFDVVPVQ